MKGTRLFILLAILFCSSRAFAFDANGIVYTITSSTTPLEVKVSGLSAGSSYEGAIVIPESVEYEGNTYSVTAIGSMAFGNYEHLTSITIPSSVTSISSYAFFYCTALTRVDISDLAAWCNIPFDNETSNPLYYAKHLYLNGEEVSSLVIPSGVTTIKMYAFSGYKGLTSVTIPGTVKTVEHHAFLECTMLQSATISEGVTSIGSAVFYHCTALTSITIPSTVGTVGTLAFEFCTGLQSATISDGVSVIDDYAFDGCTALSSIALPNSVRTVGKYAFQDCSNLQFATISEGVTSIGWDAFRNCIGLTSMVIPNTVKNVEMGAFCGCTGLQSVTIPEGVTFIGESAFDDCSKLTSITIPSTVGNLSNFAFSGCTGLQSVTITEGVTSIGDYAFCSCSGLSSITIPGSVTSIGNYAFCSCSGLSSVTIPGSVASIGSKAFKECSGITSVTISEGTTSIGEASFCNCPKLASVTIPSSITSMGASAFESCTALTHVDISDLAAWCKISFANQYGNPLYYAKHLYLNGTKVTSLVIPSGVTAIKDYAFINCPGLTSLVLPNSLTSIGNQAFTEESQGNMTAIYSLIETPSQVSVDENAFYNHDIKCYIPIGTTDAYNSWYYTGSSPVFSDVSEAAVIVMSSVGYATYCSTSNLDFSADDGLDAYLAAGYSSPTLTVAKCDKIPAESGMLLKGNAGVYTVPKANETTFVANLLIGTNKIISNLPQISYSNTNFVLSNENGEVGFYKVAAAGLELAAHRAYLSLPTANIPASSKKLVMNFNNEGGQTTDIKTVELDSDMENAIYNLQGQKVDNPERGIYIVKGKKMYIE